jgi:glucosamine kinase
MSAPTINSTPTPACIGLDAGGTQTRWALADAQGRVWREGSAGPVSGLQLGDDAGRAEVAGVLRQIVQATGPATAVAAGVTGLDERQAPQMRTMLAQAFGASATLAHNDIELLCHAHGGPGRGLVLIAGTGSVAAGLDAQGTLQRAGGRGLLIDDAGSGTWIAREALRQVWRAEDAEPGAGQRSPLARALFEAVGGSSWAHTRQWVYGASRGELGTLALAVAKVAGEDPAALALLQAAGRELARLVLALSQRLGPQPVALAGRVFDLHPAVLSALREALPHTTFTRIEEPAHHAAARLASGLAAPLVHDRTP